MNEVDGYELGLRVTQAARLFPSDPEAQALESAGDQNAALLALASAASRMTSGSLGGNLAERIQKIIGSCYDRTLTDHGADENASLQLRAGIGVELSAVKRSLLQARRELPLRSQRWFTLGIEIAAGIDHTWSDGKPTLRQPEYDPQRLQRMDSTLVFVDPQLPRWEWQHEDAVTELAQQLNVEVGQLFPAHRELTDADFECLGGLDVRTYWGWGALEKGLSQLREAMADSDSSENDSSADDLSNSLEPGFLGLMVDRKHKTVERKGQKSLVTFRGEKEWQTFRVAFEAGADGATVKQWKRNCSGSADARRRTKSRVQDKLTALEVGFEEGELRLIHVSR